MYQPCFMLCCDLQGYAFVTMASPDDMQAAISMGNG